MSTPETITYDCSDAVCRITLNRPEKRNALNGIMVKELTEAFDAAAEDPEAKVVLLGAEGPVFSAGADLAYLRQMQQNSYAENLSDSLALMNLFRKIYLLPKPVVARVEGHAVAGGCGLATVCDLVYSVPAAKFGYTEVRIGFLPALVMVFLLRKIPEAHVRELLLTGSLIDARRAAETGLINAVIPGAEIKKHVETVCAGLVNDCSRVSMQNIKEMMSGIRDMDFETALYNAAERNAKARESADCKKGIQAFLDKQKPGWR